MRIHYKSRGIMFQIQQIDKKNQDNTDIAKNMEKQKQIQIKEKLVRERNRLTLF